MKIYVNGVSEGRRVTLGPMTPQQAMREAAYLQRKGYYRVTLAEGLTGPPIDIDRFPARLQQIES